MQLLVDGNERLLGNILGVLGRTERGKGGAVHRAPVALDELAEGLVVAGLGAANQGQIARPNRGWTTTGSDLVMGTSLAIRVRVALTSSVDSATSPAVTLCNSTCAHGALQRSGKTPSRVL